MLVVTTVGDIQGSNPLSPNYRLSKKKKKKKPWVFYVWFEGDYQDCEFPGSAKLT